MFLFLKFGKVFNVVEFLFCMNKRGMIGTIAIVGILLVVGFFWFVGEMNSDMDIEGCVKASCCHSAECVWESEAPGCSDVGCTENCEPGTMDCGAGECGVVDGECGVVWNE